jgi:tetratricopeptide (TPR) repeat protein
VTTLAALAALLPLVRRGYRKSVEEEEGDDAGRRSRAASPLAELNGDELLEARRLLPLGVAVYDSRQLSLAVSTFSSILSLACGSSDKAIASEWLGRALYRLARSDGNDLTRLGQAISAFERAIRLDPSAATPRANLGRAKYRSGDYKGAVVAFRAALKRDDSLPFAHEFLAKSLWKVLPRPPNAAQQIEQHLLRAIELSPTSKTAYRSHAFLGEFLHLSPPSSSSSSSLSRNRPSRLSLARQHLLSALSLRSDYPSAHARLAYIANESLDPLTAATHYRALCTSRHTGFRDDDLEASEAASSGTAPWFGWVFVTQPGGEERREVLRLARKEYPNEDLFALLDAVEHADSSPTALEGLLSTFRARAERYKVEEDLPAHGLYAVALLASSSTSVSALEAEKQWNTFAVEVQRCKKEQQVVEGVKGRRDEERELAWIAMGWYEGLRRREEREGEGQSSSGETEMQRPLKVMKEKKVGRVKKEKVGVASSPAKVIIATTPTPTPTKTVARRTRATSAALEEQEKVEEKKVEKKGRGGAARVVEVRQEEGEKTPLRRSPRKVVKREEEE